MNDSDHSGSSCDYNHSLIRGHVFVDAYDLWIRHDARMLRCNLNLMGIDSSELEVFVDWWNWKLWEISEKTTFICQSCRRWRSLSKHFLLRFYHRFDSRLHLCYRHRHRRRHIVVLVTKAPIETIEQSEWKCQSIPPYTLYWILGCWPNWWCYVALRCRELL